MGEDIKRDSNVRQGKREKEKEETRKRVDGSQERTKVRRKRTTRERTKGTGRVIKKRKITRKEIKKERMIESMYTNQTKNHHLKIQLKLQQNCQNLDLQNFQQNQQWMS